MRLNKIIAIFTYVILGLQVTHGNNGELQRYELGGVTQGTTYQIVYYADKPQIRQNQIDALLERIDKSMSLYRDDSKITRFNDSSVHKLSIDTDMTKVIDEAFKVYHNSDGLFDITVKPLVSLWGFSAEEFTEAPSQKIIDEVLPRIGMDKLKLDGDTLYKLKQGIEIDLDGIAQGYSVDVVAQYIMSEGIENFVVEIGGELFAKGIKPDGKPMQIALYRPFVQQGEPEYFTLGIDGWAVTSSGVTEQYRHIGSKVVSHHIDPKTGHPLENSNLGVTVIASTAMQADAWDNVFMAMTVEDALETAEEMKDLELYIAYKENGEVKEQFTSGFKKYLN